MKTGTLKKLTSNGKIIRLLSINSTIWRGNAHIYTLNNPYKKELSSTSSQEKKLVGWLSIKVSDL